jgi:hypothetical protein
MYIKAVFILGLMLKIRMKIYNRRNWIIHQRHGNVHHQYVVYADRLNTGLEYILNISASVDIYTLIIDSIVVEMHTF